MSDDFVRPQEAADRPKKLDAEKTVVQGLEVYRLRHTQPAESLRLDDAGSGVLYIGVAPAGSAEASNVWKIKKVLTSGSNTSILWPSGSTDYGFSWAARAGLSYS